MPAYVQLHTDETAPVVCPDCMAMLPMHVRDVEPNWNLAKIDFIYECSECGTEVRQTLTKPERCDASEGAAPASDHSRQNTLPLHAERALV